MLTVQLEHSVFILINYYWFLMRTWMCLICGWVYDEATGAPDEGLAPGTRWEDIPDDWICPECAARKVDFEMVEV
ncbi:Rubredoxin [Oligella urethralis]|nr:Rubredoxin [Oligella urethralis]